MVFTKQVPALRWWPVEISREILLPAGFRSLALESKM